MPEPGMGGSQDSRSGSGNSGSSSGGGNQGGGGGNQGGNGGGGSGDDERGMSPGRSQAQFGTTEFAGKTPQQAQNEINRGGGSDQAQAVQQAIAAQQAAQAEAARQEQARQAAAAAQARAQAAAAAEAARQDQLAFAREQSLSQPSPSTNYLSSSPFATGPDSVRGVKTGLGIAPTETVPTETLSDFLNARGADFNPVFTADGTIVDNIPGSYDPTKETYIDEGDYLGEGKYDQSEYERIAGITDTNPFGNNPVAGSSTMFGRGIETVANKLGLSVDKRGNLTKGQQDFIRDNAFDRYNDPFGEAKMFSTMRNFNLSDTEKAEYAKQQQLQGTNTPSRVQTYAERAEQLGEDPSRYQQSNTIRSGLSEGDLTTFGPVVGRPRDMSDPEIAARLGLAATPLGIPVAALEGIFGLNRELGIEGQLGPDGKTFVPAEGQGGLGQLFNVVTGGAGTKAIDRASQIATGLINPRAGTQSAFDGVDDFGNKPPSFFERMFGGGSGSQDQNFDQGGNGGDSPVVLDPVNPPSDDTSEVIDPALFAQEKYAGLSGPTVFDPTMYLGPNYRPPVYARPTFGLGGIPTRRMANGGYMGFGGSGYGSSGGILGQLDQLGDMSSGFSTELNQIVNGGGGQSSNLSNIALQGGPQSGPISSRPASNNMVSPIGGGQNEFTSYHKLPNGTGFEYDRRTRVALPPGAVGVSYDEYINLPKQEKQELLSAGGGLEAYTGGSSTFDESAPYDPGQLGINPPGSRPPGFYDNDPLQKSISNNPFPDLFPDQRPQPLSYGIGNTTYGY